MLSATAVPESKTNVRAAAPVVFNFNIDDPLSNIDLQILALTPLFQETRCPVDLIFRITLSTAYLSEV
tara:strand:- start:549 stop:752 length:204 start_codon:yes stop_codon:yes gene_type:complete